MKKNIKFRLVLTKNDGTTKTLHPTRKSKISRNPVLNNFKSGYLKVTYLKDVFNSGTFGNKAELLKALSAWTEPVLLDFISEGDWE